MIAMMLMRHGVRAAYHQYCERRAIQRLHRADTEPHLAARLNLLAQRKGEPLNTFFELATCRDVRELTYERIEHQRGGLAEQLRFASLKDLWDLYQYVRYFGDFRVANFLRTQALFAHLRAQEQVPYVKPAMLAAAIETENADLVLKLGRTKMVHQDHRIEINEATAMAHALRGEINEATRLWGTMFSPCDLLFRQTIAGRTIAVVGPAPSLEDVREEIDSFDLVVRTNYHGNVNPQFGSRTDISYYNQGRLSSRSNEIVAFASHLTWLVALSGRDQFLRDLLPTHPGIRSTENQLSLFLHAYPLGVPRILSDLVRFRPARIKVFCTNFFASDHLYTKEYRSTSTEADTISHSLRIQDPFSSFGFVQQVYMAGLCEVDEGAREVLALTREEYAGRLQRLYGNHTVVNDTLEPGPSPRGRQRRPAR
jgi:hypothetical protein